MSSSIFILVAGFAVIWLLIVMPQRRRQKAQQELIGNLAPGDYVITSGGLYGTVTDVGEDDLGLEVAPDVEVRVSKRAIGGVVPPEEIEEVEIEEVEIEDGIDGEPERAVEENRG
jgi:preprotein translocase subunit YajC